MVVVDVVAAFATEAAAFATEAAAFGFQAAVFAYLPFVDDAFVAVLAANYLVHTPFPKNKII